MSAPEGSEFQDRRDESGIGFTIDPEAIARAVVAVLSDPRKARAVALANAEANVQQAHANGGQLRSADVAAALSRVMRDLPIEIGVAVLQGPHGIAVIEVGEGDEEKCEIDPRLIIQLVREHAARACFVTHNHPAPGDGLPSPSDRRHALKLFAALRRAGLANVAADEIVLGSKGTWSSLRSDLSARRIRAERRREKESER